MDFEYECFSLPEMLEKQKAEEDIDDEYGRMGFDDDYMERIEKVLTSDDFSTAAKKEIAPSVDG